VVIDLDTAAEGDNFEIRFSADDLVCVQSSIDTNLRTTANSVGKPVPTATAAVAPATVGTCTDGWTAWTTATGWKTVTWLDATLTTKSTAVDCFTIATDTTWLN